mmetsp:Transcript_17512/g.51831  ORF Transcript_17512/g.51831 Transcript_17512/m.51831 type:complete len:502 (-) Transcript_17512:105-1610(-)
MSLNTQTPARTQGGRTATAVSLELALGRVLCEERRVEAREALGDGLDLVLGRQERRAEVPRAVLLAEARARHRDEACRLQQTERVERVGRELRPLGRLDGARRQRDRREEVHGALGPDARHAVERVERGGDVVGAALQRGELGRLLLLVGGEFLAARRRVDHEPDGDLAHGVGAERDGRELDELRLDGGRDVRQLEVAAPQAALAREALRDGVERHQRNLRSEVVRHLFERDERRRVAVDVLLVDLVRHERQARARLDELDDGLERLQRKRRARGVAGVDDDEELGRRARRRELVVRALELRDGRVPVRRLVQVVRPERAVEQRRHGRVERVLRRRREDAVLGTGDQQLRQVADARRRAVREEDLVREGRHAVARLDERRDLLADERDALRRRVRADAALDRRAVRVRALADLLGHAEARRGRQDHVGQHRARERGRRLAERLRVADVAEHDLVEGPVVVARVELLLDLRRAVEDLAADGVLRRHDVRVYHVYLEFSCCRR